MRLIGQYICMFLGSILSISVCAAPAQRIISLDYCADQYVLKFAERDRILALSPESQRTYSYLRDAAQGIAQVRPVAEDVLILQPDLIVRSYGGGPSALGFFKQADIPVLSVGWANDLAQLKTVVQQMADGLGASKQGVQVVDEMEQRLQAIAQNVSESEAPTALYLAPSGVTTGPGSIIHQMLVSAGLQNFQTTPGWRSLPLERLVREQPDIVAAAFYETFYQHHDQWSASRHPVARAQLKGRPVVALPSAWTACGGWYVLDAIEALAAQGEPVS